MPTLYILIDAHPLSNLGPLSLLLSFDSAAAHIPGVVSTVVADGPYKVFCGGLPTYLTDDQVCCTSCPILTVLRAL